MKDHCRVHTGESYKTLDLYLRKFKYSLQIGEIILRLGRLVYRPSRRKLY